MRSKHADGLTLSRVGAQAGGDDDTFQAEADAALAEALDAVCSGEGATSRAAIERHLQRLPQLRQHLLASAAMALLADAVDAADPDLTSVRIPLLPLDQLRGPAPESHHVPNAPPLYVSPRLVYCHSLGSVGLWCFHLCADA